MPDVPPMIEAKTFQMFVDHDKNEAYKERVTLYHDLLSSIFPGTFKWQLHCTMVREMVRRELEMEIYDRMILNDMECLWLSKRRKELSDMLRSYRNDLGITLPKMKLLLSHIESGPVDFVDGLDAMIVNWQKTQS